MVRSDQQLVERMTFIFHDWFANSNDQVNSQQLMLEQNELFRSMALGSFDELFLAVTTNPAMLLFLNGTSNNKWDPNENYAREMMELFSLGADRGAYTRGRRARNGARADGLAQRLVRRTRRLQLPLRSELPRRGQQDGLRADGQVELRRRGAPVRQPPAARFVLRHQAVGLLHTQRAVGSNARLFAGPVPELGHSIRAIVEAILQHPDFYEGPELVTPPVVYNAGLLRSISRPIDTTAWAWLSANAGQQLFYPPNVSGWDFTRWLDTSTARARWEMASYVTSKTYPNPWPSQVNREYSASEDAAAALASALAYWANPRLSPESEQCIAAFAQSCLQEPLAQWQQSPCRAMRQNALRMLIATSPDMQVS